MEYMYRQSFTCQIELSAAMIGESIICNQFFTELMTRVFNSHQ